MKFKVGEMVSGTIKSKHDDGIYVLIQDTREKAFIHVSELRGNSPSIRNSRLLSLAVGGEVVAEVVKARGRNGNIRLSEKKVHEDIVLHHLPLDEPVDGVISNIVDYGAFVYLTQWSVSGLLHAKELPGETRGERNEFLAQLQPNGDLSVFVKEVGRRDGRLQIFLTLNAFDAENNTVTEEWSDSKTCCEITA